MENKFVIKRKGHKEKFDEKKLFASIYSAARISGLQEQKAEKVASKVLKQVIKSFKGKTPLTSDFISKQTIKSLKKINKEIAFMYETHRDIS